MIEIKMRDKKPDEVIVKKSRKKKEVVTYIRGLKKLPEKIEAVRNEMERYLGDKRAEYNLITNLNDLDEFVGKCLVNGVVAIDTETDSLDPMTCKLVGVSLYTPSEKAVYIPVGHVDYNTDELLTENIEIVELAKRLEKLKSLKTFWFNSKFDIRVLHHTTGVYFRPYFDAYIGARLLNENERENGLKALHKKYVLKGSEDAFSFGQLFEKLPFDIIPLDVGYLYAARDAQVTYELAMFQLPYLTVGTPECAKLECGGVSKVFWDIEMPIVQYVADMEDRGVRIDFEYQKVLSERYTKLLQEAEDAYYEELKKYTSHIYSISSSKQLSELFYDDLRILTPVFDKRAGKEKRTVDASTLEGMNHPLAKRILAYRACQKLLSTYIDKVEKIAKNGRVHTNFNQVGTDTGRFSSSGDINLQNIPSHNTDIRKMFIPSDGCVMVGSDLSGQEVRLVAGLANDSRMIQAYRDGKDLYCEIASMTFGVPYEDCKEFYPDGRTNKEGKERRSVAKKVVLSLLYGKGIRSLAEDLGKTKEEAQTIYDAVMKAYPDLERFLDDSKMMAYQKGYVTTLFGRKRRLPDIRLPRYEFRYRNGNRMSRAQEINMTAKLNSMWFKDRLEYIEEMGRSGLIIKDNGGFISRAERQCVNARVQGSAGSQNKICIKKICEDEELTRLGFKLLMTIHDEVVGECPAENAKEVKERLSFIMVHSLDGYISVPMSCDTTVTDRWYGNEIEV